MKTFPIERIKQTLGVWRSSHEYQASQKRAAFTMLMLFVSTVVVGADRKNDRRFVESKGSEKSEQSKSARASDVQSSKLRERPQSGWLYVLDTNDMKSESQVLLVDPEQERVIKTFTAGMAPDMALSTDGTRLYVAYTIYNSNGWGRKDFLEVIDTASGSVLKKITDADRWISTVPQYPSSMTFSADGRWLYVFKHLQTSNTDTYFVATFDPYTNRFLPEKAMLRGCVSATMLSSPKNQQLDVICSGTSDIQFLEPGSSGAAIAPAISDAIAPLPKLSLRSKDVAEHGRRIGPSFLSSDGRTLTVIMGDGRLFEVNNESRDIMKTGAIDSGGEKTNNSSTKEAANVTDDGLAGSWIRNQAPVFSPDGAKVYLGIGRLVHLNQGVQSFDRVMVFDSRAFKRTATIKTAYPFESLALSRDGRYLYAISTEQASIMVLDTADQGKIRTIYGIGRTPIRAIVAP
ncbi:MAG TPA: amine dehydrogenase large subunit [Blastocatellia bacterium]|nr:amine dehydrogenase large subunit [Blastocatellia bacterium]